MSLLLNVSCSLSKGTIVLSKWLSIICGEMFVHGKQYYINSCNSQMYAVFGLVSIMACVPSLSEFGDFNNFYTCMQIGI